MGESNISLLCGMEAIYFQGNKNLLKTISFFHSQEVRGEKWFFLLIDAEPVTKRKTLLSAPAFNLGTVFPSFDCLAVYGQDNDLSLAKFHERARLPLKSVKHSGWENTVHIPVAYAFLCNRVCSPPDFSPALGKAERTLIDSGGM